MMKTNAVKEMCFKGNQDSIQKKDRLFNWMMCLLLLTGFTVLSSSFTPSSMAAEEAVELGTAGDFGVLAGSTVTNVVSVGTVVTGDVGVWPGTEVTGFPPGVVNGTIHAGDFTAETAQGDLTTALGDAAGRVNSPIGIAGNLGGQTLTPGLYKSTSSLEISSGDLTLDAQGDAQAVFIFQMASTFDMTVGRKIILSGDANPFNIFWYVGSSATFGVNTVIKGTILAEVSITLNTGATLDGRALAKAGVSLEANVIRIPLPPPVVSNVDEWQLY